jgi:hypothetical protein
MYRYRSGGQTGHDARMDNEAVRPSLAAHHLAEVLASQSDQLDSLEIGAVGPAMGAIRSSARQLIRALEERGWRGDVLYGLAGDLDDDDSGQSLSEFEDVLADLEAEAGEEDDEVRLDEVAGPRMTYQARQDFIVVDEARLLAYVRSTGDPESEQPEDYTMAFYQLLDEPLMRDYTDAGLVEAGARSSTFEIPRTLWEMEGEEQDDAYPV